MSDPARDTAARLERGDALSAWLDGELTDAEAAALEAELEGDPELRAELADLEGVVRLLREDGPAEAPPDFHARVMARVEEEHPVQRFSFSSWFSSKWEGFAIGLAAVAALLLVLPVGWQLREAPPGPDDLGAPPEQTSPAVAAPRADGAAGTGASAPEGLASAPEERPVEPAAPAKGGEVDGLAPRGAARKTSGVPPEVLGKATTGGATTEVGAPEGTADEAPERVGAPPLPEVAVSAGLASDGRTWRTVVRSEDPTLKRQVLSVATRYGSVSGPDGAEVTSGAMAGSREQLVVTLDPTKLAAFQQELVGLGMTVESQPPTDLMSAGPVEVRVTLQLLGSGAGAGEEPRPPAASRAYDLDVSK